MEGNIVKMTVCGPVGSLKISGFWIIVSLIVAKCCGVYRIILSNTKVV